MSQAKNAVKVTIGGEEFTVRSELPPEYTREVAAYLDAALKRVRDSLPDGRDPQGRDPGRAGDHRRAVPGPPRRPPDRGPAHPDGRRVRPPAAAVQARLQVGRLLAEISMPQNLLLPALVGVAAGLIVALCRDRRQRSPPAAGRHGHPRRRARPRPSGCAPMRRARARRRSRRCWSRPRWKRSSSARTSTARCSAGARSGSGSSAGPTSAPARRSGSSRRSRRASARWPSGRRRSPQREQALRAREGEADRLAQEQRVKLERIAGLTAEDARREILQRIEDEARAQAAGARARHQGAGQARRRPRGPAHHLDGHPAPGRRAHRREHRGRRGAPQRRDEGPDHRPRGPEHPRLRDRHRRRRHHRRHARHGERDLLRPDPPRGRPPLARGADPGRPDPSGPDRGDRAQGPEGARGASWSSSASRRPTTPGSTGSTPR